MRIEHEYDDHQYQWEGVLCHKLENCQKQKKERKVLKVREMKRVSTAEVGSIVSSPGQLTRKGSQNIYKKSKNPFHAYLAIIRLHLILSSDSLRFCLP